ncbi:MAG: alginate export family protein [Nitrospirota bacterium]
MAEINDYLPEPVSHKLNISGQLRYRLELRDNFDFDDSADDNQDIHLLRTRINVDYAPYNSLHTFVQLQDSRILESEFPFTPASEDRIAVRQAYVDMMDTSAGWTLRLGRQELSYGDQRLLGGFNWSNLAYNFDALKLFYEAKTYTIDAFAAKRVLSDDNNFNRWDKDDTLYGLWAKYTAIDRHNLDFYYFLRDINKDINFGHAGSSEMTESTIGFRIKGSNLNGFDYLIQYARQFGDFGSLDIKAYAIIGILGYSVDHGLKPRVSLEWDFASGDKSSSDGERNTFDNLWPTNHLHYGYMDRASLQNLNNYRFNFSLKPANKLYLQADFHIINLDETSDAYYNVARKAVRTAANPDVDTRIGSDIDFMLKYRLRKNIQILSGYSHFGAGKFLKETGADDDADFFYLQTTFNF